MTPNDHLSRLGLALPPRRPTVLAHGSAEALAAAYPELDAALAERPGHRLVLSAAAEALPHLRRRYPHEVVLPEPMPALAPLWRMRLGVDRIVEAGRDDPAKVLADLPPAAYAPRGGRLDRLLVRAVAGPPIGSVSDLASRLGRPDAIVCLGNGPSSEDPRLAALAEGAALFRVNWIWRARGFLDRPSVVFTIDPDLPDTVLPPILIFPDAPTGLAVLRRHVLRGRPPRAGYGFLDGFRPAVSTAAGRHVPTNGALMIAVAAALAPARLVIAGIDLYRHPAGRYPGDGDAVDGYAREHRVELDLAVIASALAGFRGDLVILSDNLRAALGRR